VRGQPFQGVRAAAVHNGLIYIVTSVSSAETEVHNFFAFDLIAVFHAEGPFAPLMASRRLPFANVFGISVDAESTMWIAFRESNGVAKLAALKPA
jgi:hypothetical protein